MSFSNESLKNISELGDVLRGIRTRLIKEGKIRVKRKSPTPRIVYRNLKPKSDNEVKEQEGRVDGAFDILFKEIEKGLNTKG